MARKLEGDAREQGDAHGRGQAGEGADNEAYESAHGNEHNKLEVQGFQNLGNDLFRTHVRSFPMSLRKGNHGEDAEEVPDDGDGDAGDETDFPPLPAFEEE